MSRSVTLFDFACLFLFLLAVILKCFPIYGKKGKHDTDAIFIRPLCDLNFDSKSCILASFSSNDFKVLLFSDLCCCIAIKSFPFSKYHSMLLPSLSPLPSSSSYNPSCLLWHITISNLHLSGYKSGYKLAHLHYKISSQSYHKRNKEKKSYPKSMTSIQTLFICSHLWTLGK